MIIRIISEADAGALSYLDKKREGQNAGLEIIILGRGLNGRLLEMMGSFSIPVMAAESVNDIRCMTADGFVYSELQRIPVAVYIPVWMLRSRQLTSTDGRFYCDDLWNIDMRERTERNAQLEDRYNHLYETYKTAEAGRRCLIISMPGCTGTVREMLGDSDGIDILGMNLLSARQFRKRPGRTGSAETQQTAVHQSTKHQPAGHQSTGHQSTGRQPAEHQPTEHLSVTEISELYKRIIIIGHGSRYVRDMLADRKSVKGICTAFELSGDRLCEPREVRRILKDSLFPPGGNNSRYAVNSSLRSIMFCDDDARVIKPALRPVTDRMCDDCLFRRHIKEMFSGTDGRSVYEDIYCEKRGTLVRSGLSDAVSAYSGSHVVTNRKDAVHPGIITEYIGMARERILSQEAQTEQTVISHGHPEAGSEVCRQ